MLSNLAEDTVASKEPHIEEDSTVQGTFVEAPYLEDHLADNYEIKEKMHHDSSKYVAGFLAYKLKHKYNLGSPTKNYDRHAELDWLQIISRGSLFYPNEEMRKATHVLESTFHSMYGSPLINFSKTCTEHCFTT
nr:unnamed protein product [Callosobruchus analis]